MRSGSAATQLGMRVRRSRTALVFLSATSWAMVMIMLHRIESVAGGAMLDPGSASRSGRALILVVRRRGSGARSQAIGPGRGSDPPVFWAGNTEKSQTTHSIIHPRPRPGNPENRLSRPSRAKCSLPSRSIRMAVPPVSPAAYFRHRPKVRKRRSLSILRSTMISSRDSLRRRTS